MNKLAEGPAHDAMVDVLATLELARRLKAEPQMWGYLTGYFDKKIDADRIHKLPSKLDSNAEYALGLFVLPKLGNKCQWCAPVISIGQHHHYKNQTLWLRLDLPELAVTTAESIDKTTWALSKKLGDVGFVLPMTDHYTQHVKQKRKDIAMTNLAWIKENPELFQAVCDYHQERKYEVYPHTDVDAVLYQSKFWTSQETKLCGQFHREPDEQKSKIIDQLDNPDLREMAIRALGRYNPEFLSAGQRAEFDTYLKACFTQDEAKVAIDFTQTPRYNLPQFYQDIVDVRKKKLTEAQEALIKELEARLG
jgi:exodeoxyribonuclease-1